MCVCVCVTTVWCCPLGAEKNCLVQLIFCVIKVCVQHTHTVQSEKEQGWGGGGGGGLENCVLANIVH